jgi:hypothetical protein
VQLEHFPFQLPRLLWLSQSSRFAFSFCLSIDQHVYKLSKYLNKYKTIKFPSKDTVFDYYVDLEASKLEEWSVQVKDQKVPDIDTSKAISNYTIPTTDTVSIQYFMSQFISVEHPPLLVGNAGCGKT